MSTQQHCDIFLIDAYSLLYRAYYAYPATLTTPNDIPINAVYGFLTMMINAYQKFTPTYFGICLDLKGPTFRHKLYSKYKANRSAPDEEFLVQIPEFNHIIKPFNIPLFKSSGYESDDCIGTIANITSSKKLSTYIMSSDLDLLQLVNDYTVIVTSKKGISDYFIYNKEAISEKYNLTPHQIIDFKALKGDASDNIPGVKGVGEKTAISLLSQYQSLDNIYKHLDDITSKSVVKKLSESKDMAYLSKQLVTIDQNVPITINIDDMRWNPNWAQILSLFNDYKFNSLIPKIQAISGVKADFKLDNPSTTIKKPLFIDTNHTILKTVKELNQLIPLLTHGFAFDIETTSLDPQNADIIAIAITASAGISFVCDTRLDTNTQTNLFNIEKNITVHPLLKELTPILENKNIPKICHNAKYEHQVLHHHGIKLNGIYFDTMIAAYCLDSRQAIGLKALSNNKLNHEMISFEELTNKHSSILDVPFDQLSNYVADDSNVTYQLFLMFDSQLKTKLRTLYFNIEMPLVTVLSKMELYGVTCNINYLSKLSREYTDKLKSLEENIYKLTNSTFNINSTKQLSEILFDKLGLPVIKKTKTLRSTDASVLEKLAKDYAVAKKILHYRMYQKLLSTYILRIPELVHPKSQKIHTSFNQAITATGRLSSNEPNLQNIPTRSSEGQNIRRSFISRFNQGQILSLDYSQIELRVLAHLSNDESMIQWFSDDLDIHKATASKIFNINYKDISKTQRDQAKTVNFGITYGQSAFALSEQLSISRTDAQNLISQYFSQFNQIKSFMDDTIEYVRSNGFVETMFGRIRYIDDINTPNRSLQNNAQRIAINTRVQGSAADIIKLAMIDIMEKIKKHASKMIIQVHDELVFDVHPDEYQDIVNLVKNSMETIVTLKVPLTVDIESGESWGNLQSAVNS